MVLPSDIARHRQEILNLANRHGARNVRLFGSFARGEQGPDSDVDFLVELQPGRTLMDMGHLLMDLQDLLGRRVDVVEPDAIHLSVRRQVLDEAIPL